MPKQKTPAAPPPLVLTITLSDDGALPRQGQILVQRGALATLRQFTYSSLTDLSVAIQQAAASLIQLEQHPPEISPTLPPETATAERNAETAAETDADSETDADDRPALETEPTDSASMGSQPMLL